MTMGDFLSQHLCGVVWGIIGIMAAWHLLKDE